jgi:toxin FitB
VILLDTNVISEPMRPSGDVRVRDWLDDQAAETLYTSAINLAELLAGIERLPAGKRRDGLAADLAELMHTIFADRVLAFDEPAARIFPSLYSRARSAGYGLSFADAQIAAVAVAHGLTVATRDAKPFQAVGVAVVNPFERGAR